MGGDHVAYGSTQKRFVRVSRRRVPGNCGKCSDDVYTGELLHMTIPSVQVGLYAVGLSRSRCLRHHTFTRSR